MVKYMKNKYEIIQVFILFIISILIVIIVSCNIKISTYKVFSLIHLNNNKYELIISNKDLELFYRSKSLYINNNKYTFKIIEVNTDIKEMNNIKYNELIIKINKYKSNNNLVDCSILSNRVRLITIFSSIYKNNWIILNNLI
jgi:hypothetical protein